MLHVSIPVTRCTCGQTIGDVAVHYQNLVNAGQTEREAIEILGINKICCLVSIQSFSTYPLKRARYGTSSVPVEKEKESLLKKVYRTEGRTFRVDGPASNLSEIETTSFTSVERSQSSKEPSLKFTRTVPLTEAEKTTENTTKHPLEGIGNFNTDIVIADLKKGKVVPFGFVQEDGEDVLVDVGMGYKVPILKICFVTSD